MHRIGLDGTTHIHPTCRARYPSTYVELLMKLDMLHGFVAFDMYCTCVGACRDMSVAQVISMIGVIVFDESRLHPPTLVEGQQTMVSSLTYARFRAYLSDRDRLTAQSTDRDLWDWRCCEQRMQVQIRSLDISLVLRATRQ